MDCERKPKFEKQSKLISDKERRHNILQIATREKIFIVEIKNLVDNLEQADLNKFVNLLLLPDKPLKIGYGFKDDVRMLLYSFSMLKENKLKVLDLHELEKKAQTLNFFPKRTESKEIKYKGLSRLTWNCFGKPLNKGQQMSNWSNNPLSEKQLRYAAIDALVLIKIFDFMQNKCKEQNIPYEKLGLNTNSTTVNKSMASHFF